MEEAFAQSPVRAFVPEGSVEKIYLDEASGVMLSLSGICTATEPAASFTSLRPGLGDLCFKDSLAWLPSERLSLFQNAAKTSGRPIVDIRNRHMDIESCLNPILDDTSSGTI